MVPTSVALTACEKALVAVNNASRNKRLIKRRPCIGKPTPLAQYWVYDISNDGYCTGPGASRSSLKHRALWPYLFPNEAGACKDLVEDDVLGISVVRTVLQNLLCP